MVGWCWGEEEDASSEKGGFSSFSRKAWTVCGMRSREDNDDGSLAKQDASSWLSYMCTLTPF